MKKLLLMILAGLAAVSCIYPFEADMNTRPEESIVISGDIIPGGITVVNVSRLSPLSEMLEPVERFPSASVCVEISGAPDIKAKYLGMGVYEIDTRSVASDAECRLRVNIQGGKIYVSSWMTSLPAPDINSIDLSVSDRTVALELTLTGRSDATRYYRWDFDETWEIVADFVPTHMFVADVDPKDAENPRKIYRERAKDEKYKYCWLSESGKEYTLGSTIALSSNKITRQRFHTVGRSDRRMQRLYSVNVMARSLSADAYGFLENLQKNSNIGGSLFTPVPSEVRGNIRCVSDTSEFVYGFVSVTALSTKRFFLGSEFTQYYIPAERVENLLYLPDPDEDGRHDFIGHYLMGDRPVQLLDGQTVPTTSNMQWAPGRCTDCRLSGGSKVKPDYWPNDDE